MANPSSSSSSSDGGSSEALQRLKSIEPPLWLSPSPELSQSARLAAKYLFSSLHPFCPKSPIESLLIDDRYDAEQIWQQIDLQTQPLISNLRRQVKRFEKNPEEISKLFGGQLVKKEKAQVEKKEDDLVKEENGGGIEDEGDDDDDDDNDDEDEEGFEDFEDEESDEDAEVEEEEEDEDEEEEGDGGIEDKFLKIKEMKKYVEDDEDREYGGQNKKRRDSKVDKESDEEDDDDDDDDDDEDEDDEMGILGIGSDEDEDHEMGNARYEDFFGGKKKQSSEKKSESPDGSEELDSDDEQEDETGLFYQKKEPLSTHEKQTEKLRSKIEQMEKANMEPKAWTMQGEVNAMKRPKNSALEVDLDFEHNVRPAPVITEEVTASLEELIKKRILEEHFDDVQRAPSLSSTAPKEVKEIDDNKSKKGLAEIYEEDYVKKADPASAPLSFSDEQKKEASLLFKKLCLKLDALSHFHFTPKPVIEDMSVQANVPALAMEEIAPVAVSDAAMLAPEELFAGKGDIKEEAELTQAERKRRRANKKRKFKAETTKRMEKKPRNNTLPTDSIGKET